MLNILFVDDDPSFLELSKKILEGHGEIEYADDGMIAIEMFEKRLKANQPYHLILLDIFMAEMNGIHALKVIRLMEDLVGIKRNVPIVMTTSSTQTNDILGSFKEQCDGYIVKPLTKENLEGKLKELKLI